MHTLLLVVLALALMFAFRLQGGGFYKFGEDTIPRVIRATVFEIVMMLIIDDPVLWHGVLFALASYVAATIPHSAFQGMGTGMQPQGYWWTPWLRPFPQSLWKDSTSKWWKITWDFSGMAAVGLVCGMISYIPYVVLTHDLRHFLYGVAIIGILQPLAYLIGRSLADFFPFLKTPLTEYGEALTGLGWFFSLLALAP